MAAKPIVATAQQAAGTAKQSCPYSGKAIEAFLNGLPNGYGCVVTVGLAGVFVNVWMAKKVGSARQEFKVNYPIMYSPENNFDNKFNCVQRAHQNSLEFQPTFYFLLLTGGFACPCLASLFGTIYLIGRIKYFNDYSTGDAKKRLTGMKIANVGLLGLTALVAKLIYHFFRAHGCCICSTACKAIGKK